MKIDEIKQKIAELEIEAAPYRNVLKQTKEFYYTDHFKKVERLIAEHIDDLKKMLKTLEPTRSSAYNPYEDKRQLQIK